MTIIYDARINQRFKLGVEQWQIKSNYEENKMVAIGRHMTVAIHFRRRSWHHEVTEVLYCLEFCMF